MANRGHAGPAVAVIAALAFTTGCTGNDAGGDGRYHDHQAVASCLERNVDNFVQNDNLDRLPDLARRVPELLRDRGAVVTTFVPLDPTFGEEIDGVITSPAPTTFAFLDDTEQAGQLEREADERRGNVLLFFAREPTPSQRNEIDSCLEA